MIIAIWLTGLVDLLLTAWGLSLGVIEEANPVMVRIFRVSPLWAVILGFIVLTAALYVLAKARKRVWWVDPALVGLLGVRIVVLGMHAIWVLIWIL